MEIVQKNPEIIVGVESQKDVVVIVLAASRTDEAGNVVGITDAQKDAAMMAAKSVLQVVGADVAANSTATHIAGVPLEEGESLTLHVESTLTKD